MLTIVCIARTSRHSYKYLRHLQEAFKRLTRTMPEFLAFAQGFLGLLALGNVRAEIHPLVDDSISIPYRYASHRKGAIHSIVSSNTTLACIGLLFGDHFFPGLLEVFPVIQVNTFQPAPAFEIRDTRKRHPVWGTGIPYLLSGEGTPGGIIFFHAPVGGSEPEHICRGCS